VESLEHIFLKATLALTLLLVLALAVRQDLLEQRISNELILASLVGGLALQSAMSGGPGFLSALAGAGVGLLCFLPLYLSKGMGAGDVKLMAAAGAFFGPADAFIAALLSLASGALLALVVLAWRALEIRMQVAGAGSAPVQPLHKERFPYAAAIAIGVVATMGLRGMLKVFTL
jgi:prepilin peptidase CpaA